jgi:hypothetical protein
MEAEMPQKKAAKKAAKKSSARAGRREGAVRTRQQQLNRDARTTQEQANTRAAENNARVRAEEQRAAQVNAEQAAARDTTPKEGDMVTINANIAEELKTTHMIDAQRGITTAGLHGRSGRITGQEDTDHGRIYTVDGGDFTQKVPAAMVSLSGSKPAGTSDGGAKGKRRASRKR